MEYLSKSVVNYSINVPFVLKKLGERGVSNQDLEEMKNFIALSEFHRDTREITDTWESMEAPVYNRPIGNFYRVVCVFFKSREIHESLFSLPNRDLLFDHRFSVHGILFHQMVKQFMIDHKNEIHKVFLVKHCVDWHTYGDLWGSEKSARLHHLITPK